MKRNNNNFDNFNLDFNLDFSDKKSKKNNKDEIKTQDFSATAEEIEEDFKQLLKETKDNIQQANIVKYANLEHSINDERTDSEYWVCVVFQNREQREEFARKSKLLGKDDHYLDGMKLAKALNIQLETEIRPFPPYRSCGQEIYKLSFDYEEFKEIMRIFS